MARGDGVQHGDLVARIVVRRAALDGGVQGRAEGEHVRRRVRVGTPRGLRREERRCPREQAGAGERDVARGAGDAEVRDLGGAVLAEQDVARLDVPVDHARGVRHGQRGGHLGADPGGLLRGHRSPVVEQRGETPGREVLHHQHRLTVVLGDVEHRDRVRVLEPGGDPTLAEGTLPGRVRLGGVERGRQQQLFDGDATVEPEVVGPPHHPHRTAADPFVEAVAPRDQSVPVVTRCPVRHPDRLERARGAARPGPARSDVPAAGLRPRLAAPVLPSRVALHERVSGTSPGSVGRRSGNSRTDHDRRERGHRGHRSLRRGRAGRVPPPHRAARPI